MDDASNQSAKQYGAAMLSPHLPNQDLLAALIGVTVLLFSMPARSSDFKPVRFGTGPNSFLANLQCPERQGDEIGGTVFCESRIKKNGKPALRESFCFVPDRRLEQLRPYQFEADRAVDKAVFVPAMVAGENVEVRFSFRVVFSWDKETCNVSAIPNWGEEGISEGFNYFAPQEILPNGRGWWDRAFSSGQAYIRPGIIFAISVQVSEDGVPSDPRLEINNFGAVRDVRESLRSIVDSKFIPGFHGGKPAAMRNYSIVFVGDR